MSKRKRHPLVRHIRCLGALGARLRSSACALWRALRRRCGSLPIEVLVADRVRRKAMGRELGRGLRQMQRVLGSPMPLHVAVVVQQVIKTDRQLAGCYQVGQHLDGSRFALIRLALQVDGRRLSTDELLAVLAEQCIGLATQQSGGPSVLVPIEIEPAQPAEVRHLTALRPDPLAPHPNGPIVTTGRPAA